MVGGEWNDSSLKNIVGGDKVESQEKVYVRIPKDKLYRVHVDETEDLLRFTED